MLAAVIFICVPTPFDKAQTPDLSYIEKACKTIGENLENPALIINESTSYPGTVRNLIKPLIDKYSTKKNEHLFSVSPERVDPGREDFNQKNTPRLYSGLSPEASKRTYEFYSTFCDNLIEVSTPEVAEAAKLFENSFRQVNIALVNEFAQIAFALGISARETVWVTIGLIFLSRINSKVRPISAKVTYRAACISRPRCNNLCGSTKKLGSF